MFKLRVLMIKAILVWLTYTHLKAFLEENRKEAYFDSQQYICILTKVISFFYSSIQLGVQI